MTHNLFLVGDRFRGFVHDPRVLTVSDLCTAITTDALEQLEGVVRLHRGQGVGAYEREYVETALTRRGLSGKVRFVGEEPTLAPRDVAHKHRAENVLVGNLIRSGTLAYRAELCVHAENELLLDHQTGGHVQGMIVIEAARQMFVGAFETGYRDRWPRHSFTVVWNSISLAFESFLFPLPAELRCSLRELEVEGPERLQFEMSLELHQAGRRVAAGEIAFGGFETGRLTSIERHKSAKALDACLAAGTRVEVVAA